MAGEQYPTLNGIAQSWADIAVTGLIVDGPVLDLEDIVDISWERTVDIGEQKTPAGVIVARTTGAPSYTAKLTLYASGKRKLETGLADTAAAKGFTRGGALQVALVAFNISIDHTLAGETAIRKARIEGARIKKDSADHKQGTDPDQSPVELSIVRVVTIDDKGREVVLV